MVTPQISIVTPDEGQLFNPQNEIVVKGTTHGYKVKKVEVRQRDPKDNKSGSEFVDAKTSNGWKNWTAVIPAQGSNPDYDWTKVVARMVLNNGDVLWDSVLIKFTAPPPPKDVDAPTIAIGYPTDGATLKTKTITVIGSAEERDMPGATGLDRVVVRLDGNPVTITDNLQSWEAPAFDITPGNHLIEAVAYDKAGNVSKTAGAAVTILKVGIDARTVDPATLHGCDFVTAKLRTKFGKKPNPDSGIMTADIPKFVKLCADAGYNCFRIPVYMEAYLNDPEGYLAEIELITKEALANEIYVWIDNHQWRGGSAWNNTQPSAIGFPDEILAKYLTTMNNYELDPAGVAFWRDLFARNLRSGVDAWQKEHIHRQDHEGVHE
jgi:hypothetical protein